MMNVYLKRILDDGINTPQNDPTLESFRRELQHLKLVSDWTELGYGGINTEYITLENSSRCIPSIISFMQNIQHLTIKNSIVTDLNILEFISIPTISFYNCEFDINDPISVLNVNVITIANCNMNRALHNQHITFVDTKILHWYNLKYLRPIIFESFPNIEELCIYPYSYSDSLMAYCQSNNIKLSINDSGGYVL